ncbi:MAG: DNA pilot protein [Microvirus sp.]|nr:MAG: DNA pilot protein [Microvirus sp.]
MLGSFIGPLINAGAGLLGAAMAPKPNPGAEFKDTFRAKMRMGQKFGISKLVMAGVPPGISQPADNSVGQAVANMGADIGNAVQRHIMTADQKAAQVLQLENAAAQNELLKAQTRNINMRTVREAVPPRPPAMAISSPALPSIPGSRMEPPGMTTHMRMFGKDVPINTGFSDAASAENRWGETISDWIYGPMVGAADLYNLSATPGKGQGSYVPPNRGEVWRKRRSYRSGGSF